MWYNNTGLALRANSRSFLGLASRLNRPALIAFSVPSSPATYATLREIESRLKSIRNIEKITKTMKIVASTKLNRAQLAMANSRSFGETSQAFFEKAEIKPETVGSPEDKPDSKTLLVVCSSDKGLCGGIHSGMSRATRQILTDNPNMDIAVVGEKCKSQISRSNPNNIVLSFAGIGKNIPTFADAQAVADAIISLPKKYETVQIVYNKFLNAQSYLPENLFVYSHKAISSCPNISAFEIEDDALGNFSQFALANSLYWGLAEGHACEQSARRNAMDNASKNAGDMIGKFTILFNRTRQAVITGELVEIITGAAASDDM